jgi:hypothetical protein
MPGRWAWIVLAVFWSAALAAQDPPAGTPYAVLYQVLASSQEIGRYDRLVAIQRIESKLGTVAPDRVQIEIRSRRGTLHIRPTRDGSVQFPLTAELLAENPMVVTNQPKGSLTLSVTLGLKPPTSTRLPVRELNLALAQADQLLARGVAGLAGRVRGVELRFEPQSGAALTLRGRSERYLMADQAGHIVLMREGDLSDEHAVIDLSRVPALVLPYLTRDLE